LKTVILHRRNYRDEEDYWRIRAFLREVFLLNDRQCLSWEVVRLDYWRWHVNANIFHLRFEDVIFLWETVDGRIAAVLNPENPGDVFLQVHPDFRTPELEAEMVETAVACLSSVSANGKSMVTVWAHQHDKLRADLLQSRGFSRANWLDYQRQRLLDQPVAPIPPAEGYIVRSLGEIEELPARSWASWRAFHPDEPDEKYAGWEWYLNLQQAPLYRRDLDIVAVAPEGEIAGFVTVWYDDVTRSGCFEPVGVVPEHQRRGLGKAMMSEGLRRVQRLGATQADVAGSSPQANALYSAMMSPDCLVHEPWVKTW
jgi:GNAT superfamily N-acetyltransferase